MKIVSGEAIPICIPLKKIFVIASGKLVHSNHVLVRLTDENGIVGWGETTTFMEVYGYDQRALFHVLTDYLIPAVIGKKIDSLKELHRLLDQRIPHNLMAKAGIDLAVCDLMAKAQGLPMWAVIDKKRTDRVPLTGIVDIVSPSAASASAVEQAAQGFQTIKVKIGQDAATDIRRVKAVRESVCDGIRLRVDGNCGYDRETAWSVFSQMETLGLEWIEQPLPAWDLEGMAMLADRLKTPLAVDESVYTIHDAKRCIAMGAADVVNIKVPKCGGLFRCRELAALCEASGVACFLGGCIETTPGMAAAIHFYAATPNMVSAAEILGPPLYTDDLVMDPIDVVDGAAVLPQLPGLGITINEDKVSRYRIPISS